MALKMSLFKKSALLLTVPLAFKVLFITVIFTRTAELEDAQMWVNHTKDVLVVSHELLELHTSVRAGVQMYCLTATPQLKSEIAKTQNARHQRLQTLRDLTRDNPVQLTRLDDLAKLIEGSKKRTAQLLETRDAQGEVAALTLLKSFGGAGYYENFRNTLTAFVSEEERLDVQREEHLRSTSVLQRIIMIAGAVVILIITPLVIILFYYSIGRRVAVLRENTHRVLLRQPLHPLMKGNDEITDLDLAFHNLSDQILEAEAKEHAYKEELKQRADQLAKTNAEMAVTNQENEQFVYTVSHDLRSPLVNLQGFSKELTLSMVDLRQATSSSEIPESFRARINTILDRDVHESVTFIQNGVKRLAIIIDALLRLSRAGRVEYKMESVDMNVIIKRVVAALDGTIKSKRAKVTVSQLPPAKTDATAVEQILGNLVGNALNYLDPARPGEVEIGWREDASECIDPDSHVYFIRDNGMGINEAHLPKVFVAFQRLHPTAAQGEGIGLALVKRTVDRLGGRIWLESEVGKGTIFFVCLPKVPKAAEVKEEIKGSATEAHSSELGTKDTL